MNRILIIDDDKGFQEFLKEILSNDFELTFALDGTTGLRLAQEISPDLILLDLIMPEEPQGIEILKRIRNDSRTRWIPLIVLTVSQDDLLRSEALMIGADDLVPKPFGKQELLARIALRMRAPELSNQPDEILRCGNLVLNLAKFEACIDDKPVPLTVLEFKLLKYFVQNRERLLSRDKILSAIWDREVSERVVDNHILSLRKKLTGSHYMLTSVYGGGYILKPGEPAAT